MQTRYRFPLLVVVCLVLAGCNGSGGSQQTQTVTPAPVPTTALSKEELAPGLAATGVNSPTALTAAHTAALSGSYTVEADQTISYPNGTLRARRVMSVRLAENHERYVTSIRLAGPRAIRLLGKPPAQAVFWSNGQVFLRAYTSNGTTTYNTFEPSLTVNGDLAGTSNYWTSSVMPGAHPRRDLNVLFRATNTRVSRRFNRNNSRFYRIRSTSVTDPDALAATENVDSIKNITFSATISHQGVIHSYWLDYTAQSESETIHVTRQIQYHDIGTTIIKRPPWYEKAINQENNTVRRAAAREHVSRLCASTFQVVDIQRTKQYQKESMVWLRNE